MLVPSYAVYAAVLQTGMETRVFYYHEKPAANEIPTGATLRRVEDLPLLFNPGVCEGCAFKRWICRCVGCDALTHRQRWGR